MSDYEQLKIDLETEWRTMLVDFILAGDQIFKDRKNSDPLGFGWWMVRNYVIREYPEIEYYRQIREK